MTQRFTAGALVMAIPLLANEAGAQGEASDRSTLEALLAELRLLRQAVERQNVIATRIQLVMGRLTLQDQRVARSRAALERVDSELTSAGLERNNMRNAVVERQRAIEQVTDPTARGQLEQSLRSLQAGLRDREARLVALQQQQTESKQLFEAESGRFDELEGGVGQLERELDRSER